MEIPKEFWQLCLENTHAPSFCIIQCLIQFKRVLSYIQAKMYPTVSVACARCHQVPTTLGNMFWECPLLYEFTRMCRSFIHMQQNNFTIGPHLHLWGPSPRCYGFVTTAKGDCFRLSHGSKAYSSSMEIRQTFFF